MNLSPPADAGPWSYAVLAILSDGYPPVKGRLPTRYAPVRHWSCDPFDLHVLGLPLAFILSQDQTLHCILMLQLFSAIATGTLLSLQSLTSLSLQCPRDKPKDLSL